MKKLILILLLSIIFNDCGGQEKKLSNNLIQKSMKKFDIQKFRENNPNENVKEYNSENNDEIQQFKGGINNNGFIEKLRKKNSPIEIYSEFYHNLSLKTTTTLFYLFPIGNTKEYDPNGNLINETNNDEKYSFSVEQLCELIKEEYGVDLMVRSSPNKDELLYTVSRQYITNLGKNCYIVTFYSELPDEGEFYARKNVYVDGTSGKILAEEPILITLKGGNKIPKSKSSFPQKK